MPLPRPVESYCALDVAALQIPKALVVPVRHQDSRCLRMIEPDGMTDLVSNGIAQVIDLHVAVESDLPWHAGIEAHERPLDLFDGARGGAIGDVGERAAQRDALCPNQDPGGGGIVALSETDIGDRLPHPERCENLAAEVGGRDVRAR